MILIWGRRFYGKLDALNGVCVRTIFFHVFFLPLIPARSFLVFGERALNLPLDGRSVLAGYARWWPLVAVYAGIAIASGADLLPGVPLAVFAALLALWAWLRLGRLSSLERAERQAYAEFAGKSVDVALIVRATRGANRVAAAHWLDDITASAEAAFAEEAAKPQASYREAARFADWRQVADEPQAASARCRAAALTLARIAWARSEAGSRAQAAALHARLRASLGTATAELVRAAA